MGGGIYHKDDYNPFFKRQRMPGRMARSGQVGQAPATAGDCLVRWIATLGWTLLMADSGGLQRVSLNLRRKDLLGPVTRVKKKKKTATLEWTLLNSRRD